MMGEGGIKIIQKCVTSFLNVPFRKNMLQVCCGIVEERGLSSVGIYRVPGNSAAVMALTEQVNASPFKC